MFFFGDVPRFWSGPWSALAARLVHVQESSERKEHGKSAKRSGVAWPHSSRALRHRHDSFRV